MLLCTLFLVSLAIIFHSDSSAPEIFGHSIYLVRTDAFSVVEDGSALISRKVPYEEIAPGNIIIFSEEKSENAIGEVVEVQSADGVYTFRTRLPSGAEAFVGQSKLIGKGIYISNAIGAVIGFASSPAGVAVIAVLPCSFIIVLEAINIFGGRRKSRAACYTKAAARTASEQGFVRAAFCCACEKARIYPRRNRTVSGAQARSACQKACCGGTARTHFRQRA